jgi:hypothetical protein
MMMNVGFVVLAAVDMNFAIIWDLTPCSPCVNRRFGGTYHLYVRGLKYTEQYTSARQVARLMCFLKN